MGPWCLRRVDLDHVAPLRLEGHGPSWPVAPSAPRLFASGWREVVSSTRLGTLRGYALPQQRCCCRLSSPHTTAIPVPSSFDPDGDSANPSQSGYGQARWGPTRRTTGSLALGDSLICNSTSGAWASRDRAWRTDFLSRRPHVRSQRLRSSSRPSDHSHPLPAASQWARPSVSVSRGRRVDPRHAPHAPFA